VWAGIIRFAETLNGTKMWRKDVFTFRGFRVWTGIIPPSFLVLQLLLGKLWDFLASIITRANSHNISSFIYLHIYTYSMYVCIYTHILPATIEPSFWNMKLLLIIVAYVSPEPRAYSGSNALRIIIYSVFSCPLSFSFKT
jgi:hypothetical protein